MQQMAIKTGLGDEACALALAAMLGTGLFLGIHPDDGLPRCGQAGRGKVTVVARKPMFTVSKYYFRMPQLWTTGTTFYPSTPLQ